MEHMRRAAILGLFITMSCSYSAHLFALDRIQDRQLAGTAGQDSIVHNPKHQGNLKAVKTKASQEIPAIQSLDLMQDTDKGPYKIDPILFNPSYGVSAVENLYDGSQAEYRTITWQGDLNNYRTVDLPNDVTFNNAIGRVEVINLRGSASVAIQHKSFK